MKAVAALFMVLLLFVIGTSLIAPVQTAVNLITTSTYSASVVSLSALLPLLFVVMIILYGFKGFETI